MPDSQQSDYGDEAEDPPFWRNQQIIRRGALITVSVVVLGALIGFIGYPQFSAFRKRRITQSAAAFLKAEDYRSAYLLLDQLTKEDPRNLEARRLLAQVLSAYAPDQALLEWESLTKMEPGNAANFIGYATAALRAGQLVKLTTALAALQKLQPASAEYYRLVGAAALARGDAPALREAFAALVRIEPDNAISRFGLASLQLKSQQPAEVAEARLTLEEFARGDRLRVRATLALLGETALRWPELKSGPALGARLARELGLTGSRIKPGTSLFFSAPVAQFEPDLQDLIEHMKSQPALLPEDTAWLALWLLKIGEGREALVWLSTLDEKVRRSPAVLGAEITCALSLESWSKVEALLLQGAWGPVSTEAVRFAFQARALREQGKESQAESLWTKAVQLSEQSPLDLQMLQRLVQAWHWPPNKQAQVLWMLVRRFPANAQTWRKLVEQVLASHDSAQAWRVYGAWAQADPSNTQVRIERIFLGLLTRPQESGLVAQAEQLFRQFQDNSGCRLIQALALWRAGRSGEAQAILDATKINYAIEPRAALVNGLVLASVGRQAESEKMLGYVPAGLLLPEENALIAAARARR